MKIENNKVYKTIIKPSTSVVTITIDDAIKTQINADNLSTITFKWLKFDLEQGCHVEDTENTAPFLVEVAGQVVEVSVGETLEFTSDEPGTFTIKTLNESVGNDSVEVVIDG